MLLDLVVLAVVSIQPYTTVPISLHRDAQSCESAFESMMKQRGHALNERGRYNIQHSCTPTVVPVGSPMPGQPWPKGELLALPSPKATVTEPMSDRDLATKCASRHSIR